MKRLGSGDLRAGDGHPQFAEQLQRVLPNDRAALADLREQQHDGTTQGQRAGGLPVGGTGHPAGSQPADVSRQQQQQPSAATQRGQQQQPAAGSQQQQGQGQRLGQQQQQQQQPAAGSQQQQGQGRGQEPAHGEFDECPVCGERLAVEHFQQHVAGHFGTATVGHAGGGLIHGLDAVVQDILAGACEVISKAFAYQQPSAALMSFGSGFLGMQLDLPARLLPPLQTCLEAAGVACPGELHMLLQHMITTVRQLVEGRLFGALADKASAGVHVSPIDSVERLKMFYIGGYIVSQLAERHVQVAEAGQPYDCAQRVDWLYTQLLEALKLSRADAAALPEELALYTRIVDRGGLTYVSQGFVEWLCEIEMVVRTHLHCGALRQDALKRLQLELQYRVCHSALERITTANCALYDSFASLVYDSWCARVVQGEEPPAAFEEVQPSILAVYQHVCGLYAKLRVGEFQKEVAAHRKEHRKLEAMRRQLKSAGTLGASGSGPGRKSGASAVAAAVGDLVGVWQQNKDAAEVHAFLRRHCATAVAEAAAADAAAQCGAAGAPPLPVLVKPAIVCALKAPQVFSLCRAYNAGGSVPDAVQQFSGRGKKDRQVDWLARQIAALPVEPPGGWLPKKLKYLDKALGSASTECDADSVAADGAPKRRTRDAEDFDGESETTDGDSDESIVSESDSDDFGWV